MDQAEQHFTCPYCWKPISMLLDLSVDSQTFVEDCEVCCHPMEVSYTVAEGEIVSFNVIKVQ